MGARRVVSARVAQRELFARAGLAHAHHFYLCVHLHLLPPRAYPRTLPLRRRLDLSIYDMGLAGRKTKQRIGHDPRNLAWADGMFFLLLHLPVITGSFID